MMQTLLERAKELNSHFSEFGLESAVTLPFEMLDTFADRFTG